MDRDTPNKNENTAEMIALVTGASGFIGSHIADRCLKDGYQVRVLVRKGNGAIPDLANRDVTVIEGDIRDASAVSRAVEGCDIVFHAAAVTSDWGELQDFIDINVGGTRNVAEAALRTRVGRLVYISTIELFDHMKSERIDEGMPCHIRNQPYPDTKIAATRLIWEYAARGLEVSVVYPAMVYGPGDRTVFPLIADGLSKGMLFYWAWHARMNLVYIDNLVDLVMLAATHPEAAGEGFLACDSTVPTFEAFCDRLASGIDVRPPFIYLPFSLAYLLASIMEMVYRFTGSDTRPMLTRQAVTLLASRAMFDTSKARNKLGWNPKVTYDEGFQITLDWLLGIDPSQWKRK